MFPPWLQACCNGSEERSVFGSKPGIHSRRLRFWAKAISVQWQGCLPYGEKPWETQRFWPRGHSCSCHGRRRSRVLPPVRLSGCSASLRAGTLVSQGLASGSRRMMACYSNHPAGAAHGSDKIGTLSTLALHFRTVPITSIPILW